MTAAQKQTLSSWKEIATYLNRTVRTCQRLEMTMGLPIHRLDGSPKAHVFAYSRELDAWLTQKVNEHAEHRKPRALVRYALIGLAGIAAVAAVLIFVAPHRMAGPGPVSASAGKSLAVLAFDDLSPDRRWEHVAKGISNYVIDTLGHIPAVRVTRYSAAGGDVDPKKIGSNLGVDFVLLGSATVQDGRLRVSASLESCQDGFVLWVLPPIDGQLKDLFDIQDRISMSIIEHLSISLTATEEAAVRSRFTNNIDAWDLYLEGRLLLGRPLPENPQKAIDVFEAAVKLDPGFALAHVGIAWAYMNMQAQLLKYPTEVCPKAESAVEKALALDPNLAEAHGFRAWLQLQYYYDPDAAVKGFQKALAMKPGDGMIRGMYAYSLMPLRRFEEARAEIKRAISLDPLMPVLRTYSIWIHLYSGRSEEVLQEFERLQRANPNFEFEYFGKGMVYLLQGRTSEAAELLKKARSMPHEGGRPEAGLVAAYVRMGDRKTARAIYNDLVKTRKTDFIAPNLLAWCAAVLGDIDEGIAWLETGVREHDPGIALINVYAGTVLPGVTRDPRFLAFLDRNHLPH